MAAPNEVRVNIRHNILLLKTFTIPELQGITGLKRQSIYTEVRRMEGDQLIFRIGTGKREKGSVGGRPPIVWQLTSDPEKRCEVLQSVRAFYAETQDQPAQFSQPESEHYFVAKRMLEGIELDYESLRQEEKADRLDVIKTRLEYARQEEEVGAEGTELLAAIFDMLEAKAIDTLVGYRASVVELLAGAREICARVKADDLAAEIDSYVQTIIDRVVRNQRRLYLDEQYEKVKAAVEDLRFIESRFPHLPALPRTIESAEMIATVVARQIPTILQIQVREGQTSLIKRKSQVIQSGGPVYERRFSQIGRSSAHRSSFCHRSSFGHSWRSGPGRVRAASQRPNDVEERFRQIIRHESETLAGWIACI